MQKFKSKKKIIAAKRALHNLKGMNYDVTHSRHENGLGTFAYSDSDWAGDVKTRKSVPGMVNKLDESDSPVFGELFNR